jgi:hypothetical protein
MTNLFPVMKQKHTPDNKSGFQNRLDLAPTPAPLSHPPAWYKLLGEVSSPRLASAAWCACMRREPPHSASAF